MLRFIAWQQQHITWQQLAAAHTGSSSSSKAPAASGSSSSSHRRRASIGAIPASAAAAAASKQQPQRQQFHQLLGPQLQLLSPAQAAVYLQRLGGLFDCNPGSNPTDGKLLHDAQNPNSSSSQAVLQEGAVAAAAGGGGGEFLYVWDSVLVAVLESVVNVSKVANAPVEAWEAAATLLR